MALQDIGSALAVVERASSILSEYLTPAELAAEFGICKRTLDRWYASRRGPPRITIGRKPLYRREAVLEWLRKREENPAFANGSGRRARKRRG